MLRADTDYYVPRALEALGTFQLVFCSVFSHALVFTLSDDTLGSPDLYVHVLQVEVFAYVPGLIFFEVNAEIFVTELCFFFTLVHFSKY